jgi:hypothetical protein
VPYTIYPILIPQIKHFKMSSPIHPKVEYRRVGKSGLRVSVPILGAMSFGTDKWWSWVKNEDEVWLSLLLVTLTKISVFRHYRFSRPLGISA